MCYDEMEKMCSYFLLLLNLACDCMILVEDCILKCTTSNVLLLQTTQGKVDASYTCIDPSSTAKIVNACPLFRKAPQANTRSKENKKAKQVRKNGFLGTSEYEAQYSQPRTYLTQPTNPHKYLHTSPVPTPTRATGNTTTKKGARSKDCLSLCRNGCRIRPCVV